MKKYTKKHIIATLMLVSIFGILSCSSDNGPGNAEFITLEELRITPGFEWFDVEYDAYQPVQSVIDSIKNALTDNNPEFILYVNPSCNCTGTQKLFPASVKVLQEAGVFEPQFKIYTMYSEMDNHPYMNHFKIHDLPSFFTLANSTPEYSINDSLIYYNEMYPDTTWRVEDFVFKAIKD